MITEIHENGYYITPSFTLHSNGVSWKPAQYRSERRLKRKKTAKISRKFYVEYYNFKGNVSFHQLVIFLFTGGILMLLLVIILSHSSTRSVHFYGHFQHSLLWKHSRLTTCFFPLYYFWRLFHLVCPWGFLFWNLLMSTGPSVILNTWVRCVLISVKLLGLGGSSAVG